MISKEKIHEVLSSLWKGDDNQYSESRTAYNQALQDVQTAFDLLPRDVSVEEFETALKKEWQGYVERGAADVDALEDNTQELAFAKGFKKCFDWLGFKLAEK